MGVEGGKIAPGSELLMDMLKITDMAGNRDEKHLLANSSGNLLSLWKSGMIWAGCKSCELDGRADGS